MSLPKYARYIKLARIVKGWSHGDLAEAVGKSRPTISQWESGDSEPLFSDYEKALAAMGLDLISYSRFDTFENKIPKDTP